MKAITIHFMMGAILVMGALSCTQQEEREDPDKKVAEVSRFSTLDLKVDMKRADVEKQVSTLLGEKNEYRVVPNNLLGGTNTYFDGDWVLSVTYKRGHPRETIVDNRGNFVEFVPAIDETVLSYTIKKVSNNAMQATPNGAPDG